MACRVAVIGFGPGGMFFCHHLEERRRKWALDNKEEDEKKGGDMGLPEVTCFEKASGPGGNWRFDRTTSESLWTNGPKEAMEFFDYTFADHYGKDTKLPVFLPRAEVLKYMISRVTRHSPDFMERYAQFNTEVVHVTYNDEDGKFTVHTKNVETGVESQGIFDKCIWAAGECGIPNVPKALKDAFAGFTRGPVVHSAQFRYDDWEQHVKGKHILLVGGSYSALDMAFMAIKHKVEKVTIVIRDAGRDVPVLWQETWPERKVEIVEAMAPTGINQDTQAVIFTHWDVNEEEFDDDPDNIVEIENVDSVILCTGFKPCNEMLDESVLKVNEEDDIIQIPKDWSMAPNQLDDVLLGVTTPTQVKVESDTLRMHLYHECISAQNPNFMPLYSDFEEHILAIDIETYLVLSCIMGETKVPSKEEIYQMNKDIIMDGMNIPYVRGYVDLPYNIVLQEAYDEEEIPDMDACEGAVADYYVRRLAQAARDGHYPVDFGSMKGLSKIGEMLVEQQMHSNNDGGEGDSRHKTTVHDLTEKQCKYFKSLHTENVGVPLKERWITLDHSLSPVDMVDGNQKK
eukprot:CAMPEP_0198138722 /NCGR_PEP_ID=MMETSP1443-20131203/2107_1 /TAXON_ID=186043 /ORGANISM="Entomoneis sp., Strain CCMP2396" /LENGTH=569 /DNA_ID=CAMNT_0043800623 /DNA_START=197 /DNA_END=1906 /DNA_ORIENTATION=-